MESDRNAMLCPRRAAWTISFAVAAVVSCGPGGAYRDCLRRATEGEQIACLTDLGRKGDTEACQVAATIRPNSSCFEVAAVATKRVEICDQIAARQDRTLCIQAVASLTKDAQLCERINAPREHDRCVSRLASAQKNVALCDAVRNPVRRDKCRASHVDHLGGAACMRIEDATRKEACYIAAIEHSSGTGDLCDNVVERKARCLVNSARREPERCQQVGSGPSSPARRYCYDVAFMLAGVCTSVQDEASKLQCEARVARRASTMAICTTLSSSEAVDDCLFAVAPTDGALCLQISEPDMKRSCLLKNWPSAKDGTICSYLSPKGLAAACAARFAKLRKLPPGR